MPETRPSCVLLADRHHGLTEGVRGLLETAFKTVVIVADEASLLEGADRIRPDVAIVDISLAQDNEAFGPVAVLSRFAHFDAALDQVNDSNFGLQAGIFTRDLYKAMRAWDRLEVGGVLIGEVPSWRVDHMPYGGVKESGLGREGIRFAMEEMTEIRLLVVRTPGSLQG